MTNFITKNKILIYHILFWTTYMLLGGLMDFARNPSNFSLNIPDMFFTQFPNMIVFYSCQFAYEKFLNPSRIILLLGSLILIYGISMLLWVLNTYIISALIHANQVAGSRAPFYWLRFSVEVLWLFIMYASFSFGYHYFNQNLRHQKKLRLIEQEKHEAEYAFLRAQINPHFLNNTLNFFFAKSLPLSPELADGIMTLSEIMRYSLEIDKDDRMTLIDEEIGHINNVIKINQLRFNHKLQIDFKIEGSTHNVRVIPLILITVVENILKHGNCTDKDYPVKIFLNISEKDGYVYLNTYNLKKKGPKELSSGIGLDNIKKRLAHHYQKNFILNITESETDYLLDLSLPFNATANEMEKSASQNIPFLEQIHLQTIKPKPFTP